MPPDAISGCKMSQKCCYCWGSTPDPAGYTDSTAPDPLAGFERPLRGMEGKRRDEK